MTVFDHPVRRTVVQHAFFFTLLFLVTYAFFDLVRDFLQPVFWAAVLAILFRRVYRRMVRLLRGRRSTASVLTVVIVFVCVILPLSFIGFAVFRETSTLYVKIQDGSIDLNAPVVYLETLMPDARQLLDKYGIDPRRITASVAGMVTSVGQYMAAQALALGQNALRIAVLFFLALYLLFFFLKDGDALMEGIIDTLPLGDDRERRLFGKFAEVSRATIKGTIVVGVVQGTLGGLTFWMLGISAPVFWGVIMTVLSLLPAIGAAIVWLPAAIILLVTGEILKGLVLIAIGTVVIGLVDNILRPILVGRDTAMPDYMILLTTLGGLAVFGISGFVIGPVIAALFIVVWEMFQSDYAHEKNANAVETAMEEPGAIPPPPPKPVPLANATPDAPKGTPS